FRSDLHPVDVGGLHPRDVDLPCRTELPELHELRGESAVLELRGERGKVLEQIQVESAEVTMKPTDDADRTLGLRLRDDAVGKRTCRLTAELDLRGREAIQDLAPERLGLRDGVQLR